MTGTWDASFVRLTSMTSLSNPTPKWGRLIQSYIYWMNQLGWLWIQVSEIYQDLTSLQTQMLQCPHHLLAFPGRAALELPAQLHLLEQSWECYGEVASGTSLSYLWVASLLYFQIWHMEVVSGVCMTATTRLMDWDNLLEFLWWGCTSHRFSVVWSHG